MIAFFLFKTLTMLHPQIRQITFIAMGHPVAHAQIALPTNFLVRTLVRRQEALVFRQITATFELKLLLDLSAVLAAEEGWEEFLFSRICKGLVGGMFLGKFEGGLARWRRRDA